MAAAAALVAGCVGYTAAPKEPGESVFTDPNAPATRDVAATALRWVVWRYPPEGGDGRLRSWEQEGDRGAWAGTSRFIINVPAGTRWEVYERLIRDVGRGAAPVTPQTETLPAYHLGRVHVLGDEASVDVVRPVPEMGPGPDGRPVYQGVTVKLRGGVRPWTVIGSKTWSMGSMPAMALNYAPTDPRGVTGPRPADTAIARPDEAAGAEQAGHP